MIISTKLKTFIRRTSKTTVSLLALSVATTAMAGSNTDTEVEWNYKPVLTNGGKAFFSGSALMSPEVIRIPDWVPRNKRVDERANYYMYFAHHTKDYIRLAWATSLDNMGPTTWTEYEERKEPIKFTDDNGRERSAVGALDTRVISSWGHTSFPDVHVDHKNKRFIMYVHTNQNGFHATNVATSAYGANFHPSFAGGDAPGMGMVMVEGSKTLPVVTGGFYGRIFERDGRLYSMGQQGTLSRAPKDNPSTKEFEPWHSKRQIQIWERDGRLKNTPMSKFARFDIASHPKNPIPGFGAAHCDKKGKLSTTKKIEGEGRINHVDVRTIDGGDKLEVFYWIKRCPALGGIYRVVYDITDPDYKNWDLVKDRNGNVVFDEVLSKSQANVSGLIGDPALFIDDDGTRYMFYAWGNISNKGTAKGEGHISAVKLVPKNGYTPPLPTDDDSGNDTPVDDDPSDDTTDDDNTGDNNTGDNNTGDDNTGDDTSGDENATDDGIVETGIVLIEGKKGKERLHINNGEVVFNGSKSNTSEWRIKLVDGNWVFLENVNTKQRLAVTAGRLSLVGQNDKSQAAQWRLHDIGNGQTTISHRETDLWIKGKSKGVTLVRNPSGQGSKWTLTIP